MEYSPVQRKVREAEVPNICGDHNSCYSLPPPPAHLFCVYPRNGLADFASRVLSRSHTSFTLWQRETETNLSTRRITPDQRFTVTKILHLSELSEHLRAPNSVRFAVAHSQLICDETDLGADMQKERVLLLSCSSATPDLRVSNLSGLEEGCEVHVWQPCHDVNLPMDIHGYCNPRSRLEVEDIVPTALLCSRFLIVQSIM